MAGRGVAIDIGSHSIKVLAVRTGRHGVQVTAFAAVPADEGAAALEDGIPLKGAVCGLSGRDMNLRYSQLPPTPDWQLRNLMELEIQDLSQQSGGALSADYNLLPNADEESDVDTVMLALARDEALERLSGEVAAAGGTVDAFTPNCVALYNAFLKCGPVEEDAVVCLANLGHETIDLALVKGQDLLFARNLSGGGRVLDDAIAAAFNVSARKAETLKRDLLDLDPQSRGRYASGQAEKVTMAAGGAAGAIVAAIQSSLAFCKAQTRIADLKLDKILLSGGGARLRGVRGLLREALRCPVELFDPFQNLDLSQLADGYAEQLQAMRYEAVVALGLAVGAVDESLYSLEILPASVQRRRRFRERTVWNIAAGLIGVALLVLFLNDRKAAVAVAEQANQSVKMSRGRVAGIHEQAERLVEQNRVDRAVVAELASRSVPLHGLLRFLRAVTANLPPQFWITRVEVSPGSGSDSRQTVLEIEGRGKELDGAEVGRVLREFSLTLQQHPLLREIEAVPLLKQEQVGSASTVHFIYRIEFGGTD